MAYETLLFELSAGVATITLNRPERLNALTGQLLAELNDALVRCRDDAQVRCLVITGAGRGFCAGQDVKQRSSAGEADDRAASVARVLNRQFDLFPDIMRGMAKPIIAAVNGAAVGQGLSIALAADIIIASQAARFGAVWALRGIPPESAGAFNLVRLVGPQRACELIFTGRIIEAAEAKEMGLVSRVVPPEQLMPTAREMATSIAKNAPVALGIAKRLIYHAWTMDLPTFREYETYGLDYAFKTEDRDEGIRSFLEKREPGFKGR
ncbi:MAG: enoyl-CoA hydratase/isomerase family protein [Chloroflexi bacterium]|nr:enoyl-CoA hydratase/isomerase family protein [Chloroflexota bacterium]